MDKKRNKKRGVPSLNKALQYDENGNIIVGTFKQETKQMYNAYSCRAGFYDDKTARNRKSKAAQKERNAINKGIYD